MSDIKWRLVKITKIHKPDLTLQDEPLFKYLRIGGVVGWSGHANMTLFNTQVVPQNYKSQAVINEP